MIHFEATQRPSVLLANWWAVGGIRTFIRYTYNSTSLLGYKLGIVAPLSGEIDALRKDLSTLDVEFFLCNQTSQSFFRTILHALSTNHYDVIHSHGLTSAILSYIPARLHNVKHVITLHDTFNNNQFAGFSGGVKRHILSHVLASADVIHAVSDDVKRNLIRYYPDVDSSKVLPILSGIRIAQFERAPRRNLHAELNAPENCLLIGFFGRFMAPKGFRHLIEAIKLLAEKRVLSMRPLVVAFGWGGYIREEQAYIDSIGISEYFRFMPFLEDIASTLRGVDVVVMPSLHEACGLLAMETFVTGVPLIATNCIGLREVVANTPATVIPPGDSVALARALVDHMNWKDDLRTKARKFRDVAMGRFDVNKSAQALDELYHEVIARPR